VGWPQGLSTLGRAAALCVQGLGVFAGARQRWVSCSGWAMMGLCSSHAWMHDNKCVDMCTRTHTYTYTHTMCACTHIKQVQRALQHIGHAGGLLPQHQVHLILPPARARLYTSVLCGLVLHALGCRAVPLPPARARAALNVKSVCCVGWCTWGCLSVPLSPKLWIPLRKF